MKKIVKKLISIFCKLFYPKFHNEEYFNAALIPFIFMQKILGFNRCVSWPVHFTSQIKSPGKINPGSKAPGSAMGCYIDGRNGIIIEENVWIGPRVSIISMNHNLNNYYQYEIAKPIVIRKNTILSANAIILAGVELGEHTVVAAGAIVTKSFPEGNQVLAGNPAKVIKKLEKYQDRSSL